MLYRPFRTDPSKMSNVEEMNDPVFAGHTPPTR